jgi:outer membrane receptor for ferrienterochelin and colicins
MGQKLWLLLVLSAITALPQTSQPTIRVQVRSDAGPVPGADVMANGHSAKTGPDGVAVLPAALGRLNVSVTKEGFFPAQASLNVDAAREWPLEIELQPQKEKQEEVTVYATRTDTRLQDSPLHIEVVSQDEINEEMAMRPAISACC